MDLAIQPATPASRNEASDDYSMDLDDQLEVLLLQLRDRLQGDWNCTRTDDEFLARFLRVKGYDVNRAAISVRDFYRNIERNRDLICNIRPSQFIPIFEMNFGVLLRVRAIGTGARVPLANLRAWDTSKCTLRTLEQYATILVMNILSSKELQLNGVAFLFDLDGLSVSHLMQLTPKEIHRFLNCIQGGLPVKMTAIHVINYPSFFFGFWVVVQRFMKAKLRKRFHFHSSLESLHEYFDKEMLPTSLGGPLDMTEAADQEFMERVLKEDKYAEELYT